MSIVPLLLQITALVCFLIAFFNGQVPKTAPKSWGWMGLFLWLLSLMLGGAVVLHATSGTHY